MRQGPGQTILTFPLSSSEQSEEEGEKKKTKKKKASEGHREGSSSEEGSDSSSSSESEVTSESEEEQVEPASWRKKPVRAPPCPMVGHLPSVQNRLHVSHPPQRKPRCSSSSYPYPFFLFQPPSSKSAPVVKEISLLDLEDCESGWYRRHGGREPSVT